MTSVLEAPSKELTPTTSRPTRIPRRTPTLPFWLRRRPSTVKGTKRRPTPREPRWWIGVGWLILSALLMGFVLHVALFGVLQHNRAQSVAYAELRTSLAKAETPLGQLGVDETLVPAGTPVALIEVPKIGMNEVIIQGTLPDQLRDGVGHRRDTVMPGQAGTSVLYGRQSTYGGPFGQLAALVPGDMITITTGQGEHTFEVFGIRRPGDPLPEPLASGEGRLELVTADGPLLIPSSVLYIDAALTSNPADSPARVFAIQALAPGEGAMESDPNAVLPFLFTFQWLVVGAVLASWLARSWGRWQAWIVAVPVLLVLSALTADRAMALLPNLI